MSQAISVVPSSFGVKTTMGPIIGIQTPSGTPGLVERIPALIRPPPPETGVAAVTAGSIAAAISAMKAPIDWPQTGTSGFAGVPKSTMPSPLKSPAAGVGFVGYIVDYYGGQTHAVPPTKGKRIMADFKVPCAPEMKTLVHVLKPLMDKYIPPK